MVALDNAVTDSTTEEARWPSPFAVMRRRALHHRGLLIGGGWLLLMIVVAVLAPLIAPRA